MSEEEKAYRRAELRGILVSVPIKAIVAAAITAAGSPSDSGFFQKVLLFIVVYSVLSIYAYVSKTVGNWIVGAIVLVIVLWIFAEMQFPKIVYNISEILFVCGGFTVDVYRIIKYIRLSIPGKKAETSNASIQ